MRAETVTTQALAANVQVHRKAILVLALMLRLGVVWMVLCWYPRNWLLRQAPDLGWLAHSLSSGQGLASPFGGSTGPTAFLAPGYPAVLGVIFYFFGSYSYTSAVLMMALQMCFALLTVAVIMRVAYQTCGAPTANLAGVCWAVSPPLLWLPAVRWDTGLCALLLIVMIALALRLVCEPGYELWAMTGAYCGVAMLVNPSLLLALSAVAAWAVCKTTSKRRYEAWTCLPVFLAVFAGWPIRNALVLHAFVPLRSNFGYELWQGNHAGGSGYFDPTLEPLQNHQEYSDYAGEGEMIYMRKKSELAELYISAHPGEFFALSAKRVARFWTGTGSREKSGLIESHAVFTSLLGLSGLALLFKQRRAYALLLLLPLLVFPLPYYITHPDFRFRLLLDPLLTILSAYAVVRFHSFWSAIHDQLHKVFSHRDAPPHISRYRSDGDARYGASFPSASGEIPGFLSQPGLPPFRAEEETRLRGCAAAVFLWPTCPAADGAVHRSEYS